MENYLRSLIGWRSKLGNQRKFRRKLRKQQAGLSLQVWPSTSQSLQTKPSGQPGATIALSTLSVHRWPLSKGDFPERWRHWGIKTAPHPTTRNKPTRMHVLACISRPVLLRGGISICSGNNLVKRISRRKWFNILGRSATGKEITILGRIWHRIYSLLVYSLSIYSNSDCR